MQNTFLLRQRLPVVRTAAVIAVPALASLLGIVWFRRRKNKTTVPGDNSVKLSDMGVQVVDCDVSNKSIQFNDVDNPDSQAIASAEQFSTLSDSVLETDVITSDAIGSALTCGQAESSSPADCDHCESFVVTKSQDSLFDCEESISPSIAEVQGRATDCDQAFTSACTQDSTSFSSTSQVMDLNSDNVSLLTTSVHNLVMERLSYGDDEGVVDEGHSHATPLDSEEIVSSVDANMDMLSEDSGHGGSNDMVGVDNYHSLPYQFYFPLELCGMLIGKYGRHVNGISRRSGADISVREQPNVPYVQLVSIEGTESQISEAVHAIKQRFPTTLFPQISYENINESNISPVEPVHIQLTQMFLADDAVVDVIVSSVVAPDHIFVQQPNCDSFQFLQMQNCLMQSCYEQSTTNVPLPRPVLENTLCAAPMFGGWFRALVISYNADGDECYIRFVDYGGYALLAAHLLQQIRSDFTSLPFQAVECYLDDIVAPIDDSCYPHEAKILMEQLVRSQPLVAQAVGYTDDGVTNINLFTSFNNELYNVTDELIARGVARKKEWPVESTIDSCDLPSCD